MEKTWWMFIMSIPVTKISQLPIGSLFRFTDGTGSHPTELIISKLKFYTIETGWKYPIVAFDMCSIEVLYYNDFNETRN